jgi:hypothetical protein
VKKPYVISLILIGLAGAITLAFAYYGHESSGGQMTVSRPRLFFGRIKQRLEIRRLIAKSNTTPLNMYGLAQDQDGQPISNVTITYDNFHYGELPKAREIRSDINGRFLITDTGTIDRLYGRKSGYQMACSFVQSMSSLTTATNPFLLRLWKQKGPEELIKIRDRFEFDPSDRVLFFDLIKGCLVKEGGDFKLVLTQTGQTTNYTMFDWSYSIEPVHGGIKEVSETNLWYTFQAPTDGYSNTFARQFPVTSPKWAPQDNRYFFMSSRNETVFSKFRFDLHMSYTPDSKSSFFIEATINPKSPNWETQDPARKFAPE